MARKRGQWKKSKRVGEVTLYLTSRSPYWQMYWIEGTKVASTGIKRPVERRCSTRETDVGLATVVASRKNEELYKLREFPEQGCGTEPQLSSMEEMVASFVQYLEHQRRSHGHVRNLKGQLKLLADWMAKRDLLHVQDVSARLLQQFVRYLIEDRKVTSATANDYVQTVHNFMGYVIFKKKLMPGPNPAATGRQAELDKLPEHSLRPPTIYPEQVNEIIRVALENNDTQIANLIVFVCEAGFRFQEMQFLQVGDMDLDRRAIILDVKRPDPRRVRPELRRRCLNCEGFWSPKTIAGRRPIHITNRMMSVIGSMGLGRPDDWVFVNTAGMQISQNKTLVRLKRYAQQADVFVEINPRSGKPWSALKWHWLRHYHRTRAHVSGIRREVSKLAMGHAADPIHDHYRGVDMREFHAEYEKFDSGIDEAIFTAGKPVSIEH